MGSRIEFNDTLQITTAQGFPRELALEKHVINNFTFDDFKNRVFEFDKPDIRIYHPAPTRVYLAHNINDRWLYWGEVHILEQTIHAERNRTTGKFRITKIYSPEYMKMKSAVETDPGKGFTDFPF